MEEGKTRVGGPGDSVAGHSDTLKYFISRQNDRLSLAHDVGREGRTRRKPKRGDEEYGCRKEDGTRDKEQKEGNEVDG